MKYLLLVGLVIGLISGPLVAEAFSISPPKYTFIVDPGGRQGGIVTIKNTESVSKIFYLSVAGVRQNISGYPEFGEGFDAAESWVKLEQDFVTVAPGAAVPVAFSIAVPKGAPPLAHYIGIAVDEAAASSLTVGVAGRLVALVYLQVAGTVTETLRVAHFAIQPATPWQSERLANLTIANSGTVPVSARGQLIVTSRSGAVLSKQDIVIGNELLPGSERSRAVPFSLASAFHWPGVYSVTVALEYGLTKQQLRASQSVVFIPWWSIAAGLIVIGALVWFIIRRARRSDRA